MADHDASPDTQLTDDMLQNYQGNLPTRRTRSSPSASRCATPPIATPTARSTCCSNLIEDYEGLVILTTNLKASLEPALMRRITFKIEFPLPAAEERLALWRAHLRGSRLAADVDLGRLASEHKVGGGVIRNVALRAALMAGETRQLSDAALRRALRAELEASGNVVRHAVP